MEPSADVSSLKISATSQGMFTGNVTLTKTGPGARFEGKSPTGAAIIFTGAGETVDLMVGTEKTICNPVPNPDSPPWNWGDAVTTAGSEKPDTRLVVGESIMGKWQDTTDPKFLREFKNFSDKEYSGTVTDFYDGKQVSTGTYEVYTKEYPAPMTGISLQDNTVYTRLIMSGTQTTALNFKLTMNPMMDELSLTYLDRGGVLKFKLVQ